MFKRAQAIPAVPDYRPDRPAIPAHPKVIPFPVRRFVASPAFLAAFRQPAPGPGGAA